MSTQATNRYINKDGHTNPNKKDLHLREVLKKSHFLQSLHSHQRVFPLDCLPSIVDLKITFYFCFKPCLLHNHTVGSFQYHSKMLENKLFFPFKDAEQESWPLHMTTKLGTILSNFFIKEVFLILYFITSQFFSINLRYNIKATTWF